MESDNVRKGISELGMVENRGVTVGISVLCATELDICLGSVARPGSRRISRRKPAEKKLRLAAEKNCG